MKYMRSFAVLAAGAALATTTAFADDYPSKTIEVITHAGAGGGTDVNTGMMMLRTRTAAPRSILLNSISFRHLAALYRQHA